MTAGLASMLIASAGTAQQGMTQPGIQEQLEGALGGMSAAAVLEQEAAHVGEAPTMDPPTLWPGDEAPALQVATFVKGAPISEFERGTAYLVDFWATWCGPCIASMPHLSSLQDEYGGDNFRVVGVSIWERQEGDDLIEHVTDFVEGRDETMRYTVAIDDDGAMADAWMNPSGQQGIPTAMLVDRDGRIAWIGYGNDPAMDDAIASVVAGTWDIEQALTDRQAAIEEEMASMALLPWYGHFRSLASSGEQDRAAALAAALFAEGKVTATNALNSMAWTIVEHDGWSESAVLTAKLMASAALDKLDWSDAYVLDTLAWAEHRLGNHAEAVRVQEMAIEKAKSDDDRSMLRESLSIFREAAGQG